MTNLSEKEVDLARVEKQAKDLELLHRAYLWIMATKDNVLHYVSMDDSDPAIRQMADGLGQESVGLLQDLEARFTGPASALLKPKRQYYYRLTECNAPDAGSPECICWYDDGTGPLYKEGVKTEPKNWRTKP